MLTRTKESWTASILHDWNLKHRVLDTKENRWIIPRPQIMNQGRCDILDLFCYILLKYFFDLHISQKSSLIRQLNKLSHLSILSKDGSTGDTWRMIPTFFSPSFDNRINDWDDCICTYIIYTTRELIPHRIHVMSGIFTYIYHKNQPNGGKIYIRIYTIAPMGTGSFATRTLVDLYGKFVGT